MRSNKPLTKPKQPSAVSPKLRVVGGVLALALGALGVWRYHGHSPARHTTAPSGAESRDGSSLLARSWNYGLGVGKAYVYDLRQVVDVQRAQRPYANVAGTGQLEAHVVDGSADALDLIVRIRFAGSAGMALKPGAALDRSPVEVDESAHVRIARNGQVLALERLATQQGDGQLFTSLLGMWLYVLPRVESTGTAIEAGPFFAEAADGSGEFRVRYDLTGEVVDPLRLVMHKERYARASALTRILESEHQLAWSLEGRHLLSAKRKDRFEKGARELQVEVTESGQVDFVRLSDARFTQQDLKRYTRASAVYVPKIATTEPAFALDESKVRTWEELQADLRNLSNDPESERTLELFDQVASSLVKHPEMLHSVAQEAAGQPSNSDQYRMLVGAISNLGTRDAQNALIDLADAKDDAGKDIVLKAQALLEKPATEETRAMLVDSVDHGKSPSLRSTAGLALGSALRNLNSEDDSVDAARARIKKLWSEAVLPNDKRYALQVIGNSGDSYFLGILKGEILAPESMFRADAVSALRFMKDDESAQLLGLALQAADAPQLQQAAVDALLYRSWRPEFMEPVVACFLGAVQSDLRIRCARAALQQPSQQQEMHAVLEKARKSGNLDEELSAFIDSQLM